MLELAIEAGPDACRQLVARDTTTLPLDCPDDEAGSTVRGEASEYPEVRARGEGLPPVVQSGRTKFRTCWGNSLTLIGFSR